MQFNLNQIETTSKETTLPFALFLAELSPFHILFPLAGTWGFMTTCQTRSVNYSMWKQSKKLITILSNAINIIIIITTNIIIVTIIIIIIIIIIIFIINYMHFYNIIPLINWRTASATTMSIHVIPQSSSLWDCETSLKQPMCYGDGNQEQWEDSFTFLGCL